MASVQVVFWMRVSASAIKCFSWLNCSQTLVFSSTFFGWWLESSDILTVIHLFETGKFCPCLSHRIWLHPIVLGCVRPLFQSGINRSEILLWGRGLLVLYYLNWWAFAGNQIGIVYQRNRLRSDWVFLLHWENALILFLLWF